MWLCAQWSNIIFQWKVGLIHAVIPWSSATRISPVLKHTFVVTGRDCRHVEYATVAHFDVVFYNIFHVVIRVMMVGRKMYSNQSKKFLCNVRFDVVTIE